MIIVLVGYMGSGKSTIGKDLSKIIDYEFIDLDTYIEENEEMSVSKLFKDKGEIYFRKKEMLYLKQILEAKENIVLALGGGTPCYGNNMDLISTHKNVKSFYLKASLKELAKRLNPEKENRPLISHLINEDDFIEFLGKHLFERSVFYSKASITVNTDCKSINETVQDIVVNLV
ncbi:MAG: AAA family ATPase [Winogradskyella sp.]|uniref:shikimate kinase n=1 Tax=Winogradskyella sp. TaxID=1883156 RepID=UPI0017C3C5EE|nr:shikimate kinase [Winogradskyella sp.]MBT8244473.1 AAA family ATPase [Winogradskyella sp.]NNK22929.1 AAA family ATPase [Winogradskyella sp.]